MSIYQDLLTLAKPYLGIATEKFMERQCSVHVKCTPQALTKANVPELAKWVELSAGLIMDKAKASELKQKMLKLA